VAEHTKIRDEAKLFADGHGRLRYVILDQIGEGGQGQVFRAFDVRLEREVALKILHQVGPDDFFWLKQEFRSLLDFAHPNIVRLIELVVVEDNAFFTMEVVQGRDILTWCWDGGEPPEGVEEAEPDIRSVFSQLAQGLAAIHRHGRLHRDIKPQNILVSSSGHATLLDLGLSVEINSVRGRIAMEGQFAGTLPYMSPEQMTRQVLTPASDWFGFGALLYQCLTGTVPLRSGSTYGIDTGKARQELRRVRTSESLIELTTSLLGANPANRAGEREVLDELSFRGEGTRSFSGFWSTPCVGRDQHIDKLREILCNTAGGPPQVACVVGEAGLGKTALISEFVGQVEKQGALVLRGRCHFREQVPYKALDGVIDDLSDYLRRCPDEQVAELIPFQMPALQGLFPSLRRISESSPSGPREPASASQRHSALVALGELLTKLAESVPLVVIIDDVHWADYDSLRVLQTLLLGSAKGFLVILSYRPEGAELRGAFTGLLGDVANNRKVELNLAPLDDPSISVIVRSIAETLTSAEVERCIGVAKGNPWVAKEVARDLQSDAPSGDWLRLQPKDLVAKLVEERLRAVSEGADLLFGLLAVAGFPLDERLLRRVEPLANVHGPLSELLGDRLVIYVLARNRPHIDLAHAYLRDGYLALVSPSRRARLDALLEGATAEFVDWDPFPRVELLARGGSPGAAASLA
jgi:eukaryotic-like serine/threonine-protein kinase